MNWPWRAAPAIGGLVASLLSAPSVHAQSAAAGSGAAPFTSVLQMLLALGVVLGLIALFAWLLRRLARGQNLGTGALKLRGGIMLGARERVVVIEVADTWLIVGVGAGQVTPLHAMPRPSNPEPLQSEAPTGAHFNKWLQRAMGSASSVPKR